MKPVYLLMVFLINIAHGSTRNLTNLYYELEEMAHIQQGNSLLKELSDKAADLNKVFDDYKEGCSKGSAFGGFTAGGSMQKKAEKECRQQLRAALKSLEYDQLLANLRSWLKRAKKSKSQLMKKIAPLARKLNNVVSYVAEANDPMFTEIPKDDLPEDTPKFAPKTPQTNTSTDDWETD